MCIGLAGSTKLLGRADSVKDYIKRGTESGWTEVTLSGGPRHHGWCVRREMRREARGEEGGYSSRFKINGACVVG